MRIFQFLFTALFVGLVSIQPVSAKEIPGVIVALPFSAEKGASEKDVNSSIEQLMKTIRSQPGLLEDKLLVNTNHADRKSFVHVMKWNRLADWEAMFASPGFLEALKNSGSSIHYDDAAGVFEPLQ